MLNTPEFAAYASEKLILVEVDFPHNKPLPDDQQKANRKLYQTYLVPGFPTLIFTDAQGKLKGQDGYAAGGPAAGGLRAFLSRVDSKVTGIPQPAPLPAAAGSADAAAAASEGAPLPSDVEIKLSGISGFKKHPLALINGRYFELDDKETFSMSGRQVTIKCIEIGTETVRVLVNGSERVLKLSP
jgi:hypothetical protein